MSNGIVLNMTTLKKGKRKKNIKTFIFIQREKELKVMLGKYNLSVVTIFQ